MARFPMRILVFLITSILTLALNRALPSLSYQEEIHEDYSTLSIEIKEDFDRITISASSEGFLLLDEQLEKADLEKEFQELYKAIGPWRFSERLHEYQLEDLGAKLLKPFEHLIQESDEIIFSLSPELIKIPIDLLYHLGKPLFLQKPVYFNIASGGGERQNFSIPNSAFIVSDITADPQRATKLIADRLENSKYFDVDEFLPEDLQKYYDQDLLLMSIHGYVNTDISDHISLGEHVLFAGDFSKLRSKIAYFDSCRIGISNSFLESFSGAGTIYFVAPIVNNEAGNSSTKTMDLFFNHLIQGETPEVALFLTRKELWNFYDEEALAFRAWRAFPFRVYRLN